MEKEDTPWLPLIERKGRKEKKKKKYLIMITIKFFSNYSITIKVT